MRIILQNKGSIIKRPIDASIDPQDLITLTLITVVQLDAISSKEDHTPRQYPTIIVEVRK